MSDLVLVVEWTKSRQLARAAGMTLGACGNNVSNSNMAFSGACFNYHPSAYCLSSSNFDTTFHNFIAW